jgi:hypothetical protein
MKGVSSRFSNKGQRLDQRATTRLNIISTTRLNVIWMIRLNIM